MDRITVDVRVGCALKEYLVAMNGSDVITPGKESVLWGLLKQLLVGGREVDYSAIPASKSEEYIKIALRNVRAAKAYSRSTRRTISIDVSCRCFLTNSGEAIIRRMLDREFKKTFIDYMKGALGNNVKLKHKEAIQEFCICHNIELKDSVYETLKKCWYRHRTDIEKQNLPLL